MWTERSEFSEHDVEQQKAAGDAKYEALRSEFKQKSLEKAAETAAVYAKYKALICDIYNKHDPAKVDTVDSLLSRHRGSEEAVYKRLCIKYQVGWHWTQMNPVRHWSEVLKPCQRVL